jgi:hypothetical protein
VESLFHLYSRPTVWLERLEDEPTSTTARLLRLSKFPIDMFVADLHTLLLHELGHAETAWLNGATVSWEKTPPGVSGALGRWLIWSTPSGKQLSARQHLAITAGGLQATAVAVEDTYIRMLGRERVEFSYLPLLLTNKLDTFRYVIGTPQHGSRSRVTGSDTVRYIRDYAAASGRTENDIFREARRGALISMLDPMAVWAAYQYGKFLWSGQQVFDNPMLSGEGWKLYAGAGFWLSEVGPRYRTRVFVRSPELDWAVQVMPSFGHGGQWSIEGRVSKNLESFFAAHVYGAMWSQREQPDPGPNVPGGAFGAGAVWAVSEKLSFEGNVEYKTAGALLGRDFRRGPRFVLGFTYGGTWSESTPSRAPR